MSASTASASKSRAKRFASGSIIALPLHDQVRVLRVLGLPERRGPAPEARACYEELGIDEGGRRYLAKPPKGAALQ